MFPEMQNGWHLPISHLISIDFPFPSQAIWVWLCPACGMTHPVVGLLDQKAIIISTKALYDLTRGACVSHKTIHSRIKVKLLNVGAPDSQKQHGKVSSFCSLLEQGHWTASCHVWAAVLTSSKDAHPWVFHSYADTICHLYLGTILR